MSKNRVLVVDDEPGIRESLVGILEDESYEAEAVGSGDECLARLEARTVHVVLLDIWLPAGVAVWLAPLLVGVAAVLVGWSLLSGGRKKLSADNLALQRTAHSLREDATLAREHLP